MYLLSLCLIFTHTVFLRCKAHVVTCFSFTQFYLGTYLSQSAINLDIASSIVWCYFGSHMWHQTWQMFSLSNNLFGFNTQVYYIDVVASKHINRLVSMLSTKSPGSCWRHVDNANIKYFDIVILEKCGHHFCSLHMGQTLTM